MELVLVWLVLSGVLLFAAANLVSRTTLRVVTVVLLAAGVLTLARLGQSTPGNSKEPFREVVLAGAQEVGREALGPLDLDDVPLDAAAGVAVLLVLMVAYRKAEITSARRFPGPVEVRELQEPAGPAGEGTGAENGGPDRAAMEARMRQRLADANLLPPPSVPGGSRQEQLVEVMQKSPLGDVGGFGKVLALVARAAFPGVGYDVTGTLISESATGGCGVTVSLNDSVSGQTVAMRTFVAGTYEAAIDSAAFFVAQTLLGKCTTVPGWQQWRDCRSLEAYQRGRDAVAERDWRRAELAFGEASTYSPNNVHPPLELAAIYDLGDRCYQTLKMYLEVLERFPRLIEARYRLASTYSQVARSDPRLLDEGWHELVDAIREDRQCRPKRRRWPSGEDPLSVDGSPEDRQTSLYELARRELEAMKADLRLTRFLVWRVRSRHGRLVGNSPLLLSSPKLRGSRRVMLATIETAMCALELKTCQLDDGCSAPERSNELARRLERVLERRSAGWQAQFNGACFYATMISEPPSDDEPPGRFEDWAQKNDSYARLGVDHLTEAFLDPGTEFGRQPSWILNKAGDHDLDRLRRHPRFARWTAKMSFDKASDPSPDQQERDELKQAWTSLNQVATALSQDAVWTALQQTLLSPGVSKLTVRQWCEKEHALWLALAAWARRPRQSERRERFHQAAMDAHEALCQVTLTGEGSSKSDWRDPEVTAAHHRACWASVGETATAVAEIWMTRAQKVTRAQSTDRIRKGVEAWIEESWGLWECLARCSRAPLRRAHYEEFSAKAQQLAVLPNGSEPVRAPAGPS